MAKKNKSKGKKNMKRSALFASVVTEEKSETKDYPFDEETLALAGGDVELLHSIRRMIIGMDDKALKECVDNLKNGGMPVEAVWDMILESNSIRDPEADIIANGDRVETQSRDRLNEDQFKNGEETIEEIDNEDVAVFDPNELEGKEFSIDIELPSTFFDPYKLHDALFKVLRITTPDTYDERIHDLFITMAVLCDPYTQPSDTGVYNEMILSADLVSDLIIGIMYEQYVEINFEENARVTNVPAFEMSYDLATIVEKVSVVLNMDDENVLMYVQNDADNWEKELYKWLPQDTFSNMTNIASDYHHMMLLYTITTTALLTINKLYSETGNVCLNPFLSLYLQLWKNHSKVIYLGIEIDCRDEENGFPGYPEVIRYVIKGSSAVRSMISLILNNEFKRRVHDLKHESLVNFMRPWGRKFSNGSIKVDMRVFVAALLALGSELDSVTELLFGFEPEDRYDEDVKYMFEMELEDMNREGEEGCEEKERVDHNEDITTKYIGDNVILEIEKNIDGEKVEGEENDNEMARVEGQIAEKQVNWSVYDLHPDCECEFEDFESDVEYDDVDVDEDEDDIELINKLGELAAGEDIVDKLNLDVLRNVNNGPSALRYQHPYAMQQKQNCIVDSKGRDWRDIPRGQNAILSDDFVILLKKSVDDESIFITPMENLVSSMQKMCEGSVDDAFCNKVVISVAWVVQYEREAMMMEENEENDMGINADVIYNFLKSEDRFNDMVRFNNSAAFCIIDELLMAEGYRRVLIWFLTHLPLNHWLVSYFHELLVGNRAKLWRKYPFSRIGPIELSEIEKSMLLHEFLSNAVIFLSRGESGGEPNRMEAQKLIKMICLMLISLEECGVLHGGGEEDDEHRVEIQTLLVQWVGVRTVPEARILFFKYSKHGANQVEKNPEQTRNKVFSNKSNKNNRINKEIENKNNACEKIVSHCSNKDKSVDDFDGPTMHTNRVHELLPVLKNFDKTAVFVIVLNIAAQYKEEKSATNTATASLYYRFLEDLNAVAGIYNNTEDLRHDCDELFAALRDALKYNNVELILQVARKFLIVKDDDADDAIKLLVEGFIRGNRGG